MTARVNHVAVLAAAVAFFIWGALWYTLLFGTMYASLVAKPASNTGSMLPQFAISFLMGWLLSYVTAIALSGSENPNPVRHGIQFGVFMGIGVYASMTLINFAYEGRPYALWAINAGYVVSGMAIVGAIVGGWLRKTVPAAT